MVYPQATEQAESGLSRLNGHLRIELEAVREGLPSWQQHDLTFDRAGYGLNYDRYYGGL